MHSLICMEILAESWIRPKNEITIPIEVRNLWNIKPGNGLRWILTDDNRIYVVKITSMVVNHSGGNHGIGQED